MADTHLSIVLSAPLTSLCRQVSVLLSAHYEHLYLKNKIVSIWFFMNTICTVKTPVMKNKNTFQKDQNGIKDPDIGIFQFLTHTLTHSSFIHVTFERQQMSVLQGNKVFVANSTLTFQTTITLAPPSPGMGKNFL